MKLIPASAAMARISIFTVPTKSATFKGSPKEKEENVYILEMSETLKALPIVLFTAEIPLIAKFPSMSP